jgi:hypothetical protein
MSKQQMYLQFCRFILGANWFKKYWFVQGTYWNTHHIDKNNSQDLNRVIREANEYTRHHLQIGFLETVVMVIYFLSGSIESSKMFGFVMAILVMHGYPLCIHEYNRILARQRLDLIKKNDSDTNTLQSTERDSLHGITIHKPYNFHGAVLQYDLHFGSDISPLFKTVEEAKAYRKYIISEYPDEYELSEAIYLDKMRQVYQKYINLKVLSYKSERNNRNSYFS